MFGRADWARTARLGETRVATTGGIVFSFAQTPVMFVGLLVMFSWCTLWCSAEAVPPQSWTRRVSNVLHVLMAVVMLLMVSRPTWTWLTGLVPVWGLVAGSAAATGWFVWWGLDAVRRGDSRGGAHLFGHGAMFLAMVWHLAAMEVMRALAASSSMSGTGSGMGSMHAPQSGHASGGMSGMGSASGVSQSADPMGMASEPGGVLWFFALVGIPIMAWLLVAGVRGVVDTVRSPGKIVALPASMLPPCGDPGCTCGPDCPCAPARRARALAAAPASTSLEVHACHEVRPVGSARFRLAAASDAAMNLGMFWMSVGLLVPILPFLSVLKV